MQVLSEKDYNLFEQLISLDQQSMHKIMSRYLKSKYENIIITSEYIVAIGDIPIALVAHMDTVFKTPVSNLYYDQRKNVMWSSEGLGADDRAGIFAIIKILQAGFKPSIILTTDEEKGGIGALILGQQPCPISNLKYMIELDRRGANDCVFYDCYCPSFVDYVESFGFSIQAGSFSDISFLMSPWHICGVNLSVGYENEHSMCEILNIDFLFETIEKVKTMLSQIEIPDFTYSTLIHNDKVIFGQHCSCCKKLFSEYNLIPVKGKDGKPKFYCIDCINNNVNWCDYCGEAYESETTAQINMCKNCAEELCTKTLKNNSAE